MGLWTWLQKSFTRSPAAWIWFALFLVAAASNYTFGRNLERVCDLTGPHILSAQQPQTVQQKVAAICIAHAPPD